MTQPSGCCAASTTSTSATSRALHRRIDVPVQLVWGEQDRFFPVSGRARWSPTSPTPASHVIAGAGLFSHEERPAEVAQALLPVLTAAAEPIHPCPSPSSPLQLARVMIA